MHSSIEQKDITWTTIIPLIGGAAIGLEYAVGKPPEFVASYSGFWNNDQHYMNWLNNIRGLDVPYINLTENQDFKKKVNIATCVPPCAALSQMNTGKSAESKGAGCAKNDWMKFALRDAIDQFSVDVCIIENAPALSTTKGEPVANDLYQICKERGYSLTLYKTSTHFHGIPQRRDRTFAIAWNSPTAPIMDWYDEPHESLADYLSRVKNDTTDQINPNVANEPFYRFICHKLGTNDARKEIYSNGNTAYNYVVRNNLLQNARDWFLETNNEKGLKNATHALKKIADGKGIWDGSVHAFDNMMTAVVGRNMYDSIHPFFDRSLTIKECMHMMGLPDDYELIGGLKNANHIAQNVTTCSSKAMGEQAIKFIQGKLQSSGFSYIKQDNWKNELTIRNPKVVERATLEEFFV